MTAQDEDHLAAIARSTSSPEALKAAAGGVPALVSGDGARDAALSRTCKLAVSIHSVENAGLSDGIPCSALGKCSIWLPPGQDSNQVARTVNLGLDAAFAELGSPNKLSVTSVASDPWQGDPSSPLYAAAARAAIAVHDKRAHLARSGNAIPIVATIQSALKTPTLILPLAPTVVQPSTAAAKSTSTLLGSPNDGEFVVEPISRAAYLSSMVYLAALLSEIGEMHKSITGENASGNIESRPATAIGGALAKIKDIWLGLA
jgi:hypothetical protein